MKHKTKNYQTRTVHKGFSLIELLIAMFMFVFIIMVSVSVFAGVYGVRKKVRGYQKALEEGSAAIEQIAKNIRMSSKLQTYGGTNKNIRMFNNSQGKCLVYNFVGNALRTATYDPDLSDPANPDCSSVPGTLVDMIPNLTDGRFIVSTTDATAGRIGRATIYVIVGSDVNFGELRTTVAFKDYSGIIQ